MPTYEYACSACGHEWEQTQRIVDPPIEVCPKCVKSAAHRLISRGTGFILKGGGWYSDLYASPSAAGKKTEDGKGTAETGAKAESKESKAPDAAEAKPAAAEAKPAAKATTSTPTPSST